MARRRARQRGGRATQRLPAALFTRSGTQPRRGHFLHGEAAGTRERLTCARLRSYQSHSLPFRCPVSRPVLTAHGVRITAVVAAERIVGSTHGSNAKPRFQGMAATARAINGTAAVERTRAGVNVTRETAPNYSAYRGKADWIPTSLFSL